VEAHRFNSRASFLSCHRGQRPADPQVHMLRCGSWCREYKQLFRVPLVLNFDHQQRIAFSCRSDPEPEPPPAKNIKSESDHGLQAAWAAMDTNDARQLGILTFGQVLSNLGIGIIAPVLPSLAVELNIGAAGIGAIMAAPSIMRLLCNLPAGVATDRFGRVPVMACGQLVSGLSILGFANASSFPSIIAFRLALGAGSALSSTGSQAFTADVTGRTHLIHFRGAIMGLQGAAIGASYIVGPALGGLLTQLGGPRIAYSSVGLCALGCSFIYARLPETQRPIEFPHPATGHGFHSVLRQGRVAWAVWLKLMVDPVQRACLVAVASIHANWALSIVVMPLQATQLGASPASLGMIFAAGAVLSSIVAPVGGSLSDRLGRAKVIAPGMILMALGCCALAKVTSLMQMTSAFVMWSVAEGLMLPAMNAFIADCLPEHGKAQALSLHRTVGDATFVIAPAALGILADLGGASLANIITALGTGVAALMFRYFIASAPRA